VERLGIECYYTTEQGIQWFLQHAVCYIQQWLRLRTCLDGDTTQQGFIDTPNMNEGSLIISGRSNTGVSGSFAEPN
jgi:hypothetical protein